MRRSQQPAAMEDRSQGAPQRGRSSPPPLPPLPSSRPGREGGSRGIRSWVFGSRRSAEDAGDTASGPGGRRPGRPGAERGVRSFLPPWLSRSARAEEAAARAPKPRACAKPKPALGAAQESD
uniref:Uncharacterized protein n=1 Tax=Pipistrellus kuhlii TaxID=59472 RepID=A0A7J7X0K1_PIPKU|nr:hypothetical protein mPipKuh1_010727 [Pipistrellus kuhlii]